MTTVYTDITKKIDWTKPIEYVFVNYKNEEIVYKAEYKGKRDDFSGSKLYSFPFIVNCNLSSDIYTISFVNEYGKIYSNIDNNNFSSYPLSVFMNVIRYIRNEKCVDTANDEE